MRSLLLILLLSSFSAVGQALPDSIIISRITYVRTDGDNEDDSVFGSIRYAIILKGKNYFLERKKIAISKVTGLLTELERPGNTDNSLAKNGIDTNWIKNNPAELLRLSDDKNIEWNQPQKEFIYRELINVPAYEKLLKHFQGGGEYYHMHMWYKNEWRIQVYTNGRLRDEARSRKITGGFKMPWINSSGDTLYNYAIETKLSSITGIKSQTRKFLTGTALQKHMVNRIVDHHRQALYKLSPYSYMEEINELKTDFEIISFEEYAGGRYIGVEPKTMKIVLKNSLMSDNVRLVFLISTYGKTLYSRDSIKKDYPAIISRIQSITFIADYLKAHANAKLDIYYFNNSGINEYNIDKVNKNPKEWLKHDERIERQRRWDSIYNKIPDAESIKFDRISRQLRCGCNYRFSRSYIEKAVLFEIKDANENSSIWFLLPGNKVLLYLMDNTTALDFKRSVFTDEDDNPLMYACTILDSNGQNVPNFKMEQEK